MLLRRRRAFLARSREASRAASDSSPRIISSTFRTKSRLASTRLRAWLLDSWQRIVIPVGICFSCCVTHFEKMLVIAYIDVLVTASLLNGRLRNRPLLICNLEHMQCHQLTYHTTWGLVDLLSSRSTSANKWFHNVFFIQSLHFFLDTVHKVNGDVQRHSGSLVSMSYDINRQA